MSDDRCLIIAPGLCGRLGRPARRYGKSARGFPLVLFRPRTDLHKGIVRTGRQPRPRRIARLTAVFREGTARAFPASADMNKEYRSSPAQAPSGRDRFILFLPGGLRYVFGRKGMRGKNSGRREKTVQKPAFRERCAGQAVPKRCVKEL